jgi:AmmeMemoRadiSam system protein B
VAGFCHSVFCIGARGKKRLGYRRFVFTLVVALLWFLLFRLIAFDITVGKNRYLNPDTAGGGYVAALGFIRDNSPEDAIVLSEWTQGHHVVALAERRTVATTKVYPSEAKILAERFRDIGKFFFALSPEEAKEVVDKYGVSYVFMRKKNFDFYLCGYHDRCGQKDALIYKLLAGEAAPFLNTVYETDWYKVLKVTDKPALALHYAGFGTGYEYFLEEFTRVSEEADAIQKPVLGGILPHHYPFTDAFFPSFFSRLKMALPRVVFLIGPDHLGNTRYPVALSARSWLTPFGTLQPDAKLIEKLRVRGTADIDEDAHRQEWALKTLVPYIAFLSPETKIVPILVRNDVSREMAIALGKKIGRLAGERALIVLSADFAHRLSAEETNKYDREVELAVEAKNEKVLSGEPEPGLKPALAMFFAAMKERGNAEPVLLGHETSETLHKKDPGRFPAYPYIVSYFSYAFEKQ